jgi:hypothetical protein
MIHEFAVDPALLNNWERFRYLTEKFGVCQGRLISRFPQRWKAMVYDGLNSVGEIERKKIVECLLRIDEKMQVRAHPAIWDNGRSWLPNAEDEHARQPFHAIVAGANTRNHDRVLAYDDLSEDTPLWAVPREKVVSREATSLASAVAPILRIAKSVILVDPYFDPYKPRARNALAAFLKACLGGRIDRNLPRVEFHTAFKKRFRIFLGSVSDNCRPGFRTGCR